jgi:hypothetical protein
LLTFAVSLDLSQAALVGTIPRGANHLGEREFSPFQLRRESECWVAFWGLIVVTIYLIAASRVTCVVALPLTPFQYEAQAQRHCPDDTVVWLDFRKGVYYSRGQR